MNVQIAESIDMVTITGVICGIEDFGIMGFAYLESPSLSNDGIDNDNDGIIDESRDNGIDDDGWEGF